jgi:hypothetical protein
MPEARTKTISAIDGARSFFIAYNAHQVDKMLEACSEDAQLRYVPMGERAPRQSPRGRQGHLVGPYRRFSRSTCFGAVHFR